MKKKLLSLLCVLLLALVLTVSVEATPLSREAHGQSLYRLTPTQTLTSSAALSFYKALDAWITEIAAGETVSTVFSLPIEALKEKGLKTEWTREDDLPAFNADEAAAAFWEQLELPLVLDLLVHDHPLTLCWYDKTESGGAAYGCRFSVDNELFPSKYRVNGATLSLRVSSDYRPADYDENAPTVSPARLLAMRNARTVADGIVAAHKEKPAHEMLLAFRDEILSRVSYNTAAANGLFPYGDPWQPIYVFDGDPATNVVCEGYSKALQYLCDAAGLEVYTVSGWMNGENHMWNVATMQDGNSYLLDLTNTDDSTLGADGSLFLAGAVGDPYAGYTVSAGGETLLYRYDADTLALHDLSTLTLSSESYTGLFGVGFESTADTLEFPYDTFPLKAFSRTETTSGDPEWLDYTKGAIIYFGDDSVDEAADLSPAWYALHADGTRGEKMDSDPIDAGSYVLVVTRISDGEEFVSPTVTITPAPVTLEGVTAADRAYDGTTWLSILDIALSSPIPLPEGLSLDLTRLQASLPHADAGIYTHVLLEGDLQFTTEERNYLPVAVSTLPLTAPITVSKAPAPILSPRSLRLSAPKFSFDAGAYLASVMPDDAGDLLISVASAEKWGELTVTDWEMNEYARITASFTGLCGGDRLEFLLTVTSQNYEDTTLSVVASAACPYASHRFEDYRADGNATCHQDGTKTAVCSGCTVTDTVRDVGSRLPHVFISGACRLCGTPAPLPPAEEESTELPTQTAPEATEEAAGSLPATEVPSETDAPPAETDAPPAETDDPPSTDNDGASPPLALPALIALAAVFILSVAVAVFLLKKRNG